ncbi:MAG: hypothetical protein U1E70_14105 [Acetobacteraceae bacterium]
MSTSPWCRTRARIPAGRQQRADERLSYFVASEKAITEKRDVLTLVKQRLAKALDWGLANTDAYAAAWAE